MFLVFFIFRLRLIILIDIMCIGDNMEEKIEFLRKIDSIIIPLNFTYFHHSTSYIPTRIKEKLIQGKYIRSWTTLPQNEFVIKSEMSFVERDARIKEVFDYKRPLSEASIMYALPDYSKPFCIRVIIPKLSTVMRNLLPVSEEYKKEFQKLYYGYGDGRHPKLKNGERIILIGSSIVDEISGKMVDIFYGVRECDIDLYFNSVVETIKSGYRHDSNVDLSTFDQFGRNTNFFPQSYSIAKSSNEKRYSGSPSEFELELLEDYQENLKEDHSELPPIDNKHKYYELYNHYQERKTKQK